METHRILVTGSQSGLGKYLLENLPNTIGFTRKTKINFISRFSINTIIHCANNKATNIQSPDLYKYLNDNILLTHNLVKIPCKKFIYISTVDVYPKDGKVYDENKIINIEKIENLYGLTKLMSEKIVIRYNRNYLILRPTALLGPYMKPNSLTKILKNNYIDFNLAGESKFNYVLYSDILRFIKYALKENTSGIFNLASRGNLSLLEIAKELGKEDVPFGDYVYNIGNIDSSKINAIVPYFNKNTKRLLKKFKEKYK